MHFKEVIGVDISKATFDSFIYSCSKARAFSNNDLTSFDAFLQWINQSSKVELNQILVCLEHTGLYSLPLVSYLQAHDIAFALVPALQIKRSMGMRRGKSDQLDAKEIAKYAWMRKDQLQGSRLPSSNLLKIKCLLTLRKKLTAHKASLKACLNEQKAFMIPEDNKVLFDTQKRLIEELKAQINVLEKEILNTIKQDTDMLECYQLLTSIKGIGPILAWHMIVSTHCFTRFKTWKQFACYCGIVPFEYQSGSSLKAPRRVHHFANKKIKTLLTLAAMSAIQANPEMKIYYQKRISDGKSKMSTLNIIRNKLVSRAFAVVKRGTPYVVLAKFAA